MIGDLIIEGKTKVVEDAGNGEVLVRSKDDITAGDGVKHDVLEGKAACSTQTTSNVFELLENSGIPTHFVERVDATTFKARNVRMIPLELVARRVATGSYIKRNPDVQDMTVLEELVFEIFEKDDDNHDPMLEFDFETGILGRYVASKPRADALMSDEPLASSRFADVTPELYQQMRDITLKVFETIEEAWAKHGGVLFDFKIECGFDLETGEFLVADVIDNDSWRLRVGDKQVDKQSYRDGSQSLPDIKLDYQQVAGLTDNFVTTV